MSPRARRNGALVLLVVSLIAWPISAVTWAKDEPPTTLGLSWFAVTLTCLDIVLTADVRKEQDS